MKKNFVYNMMAVSLLTSACSTVTTQKQADFNESIEQASMEQVRCLLPGTLKKYGGHFVVMSQRIPVTISIQDCQMRGGEII